MISFIDKRTSEISFDFLLSEAISDEAISEGDMVIKMGKYWNWDNRDYKLFFNIISDTI